MSNRRSEGIEGVCDDSSVRPEPAGVESVRMTGDRFPTMSSTAQLLDKLQVLLDDFPNAHSDWDQLLLVAAIRVVVVQLTDRVGDKRPREPEVARLDGLLERAAAVALACAPFRSRTEVVRIWSCSSCWASPSRFDDFRTSVESGAQITPRRIHNRASSTASSQSDENRTSAHRVTTRLVQPLQAESPSEL